MQDYQLLEKLAHQNRERIPERTVHAKGWGAYGTLKITGDISKYTCAKALQPGAETPMIARLQQHARLLRARPDEISRFHPHPEAPPAHQSALAHGDVGFLVAQSGIAASGNDPDVGSRPAQKPHAHERLRLAHLFLLERSRRALLGEIPFQDGTGP